MSIQKEFPREKMYFLSLIVLVKKKKAVVMTNSNLDRKG